ncbi:protein WVD2-like 7 isoform X2 [Euphorbia lathyris]|uniref:protein WVD2-like 7 isoform X2 n=1 Tax=Euphorbia lathyris TaxID=212925 RepID=UPI003313EB30
MAGEFEEPFSVSFKSDSLHSGSISFGRFESEDLSWERRSSFSHNKYLEEVEKCSKPGSVIEKKAYFEAHFKKRGMRPPGAFDSQNGKEDQSENGSSENVSHKEEEEGEEDNMNESSNNYAQFDDGVLTEFKCGHARGQFEEEEADNMNESSNNYAQFDDGVLAEFKCGYASGQFDHFNNSTQYADFDESLEGSEYCGEYEGMECEREDHSVLTAESQMDAASDDANVMVGVLGNMKPQEVHQSETGSDSSDRQDIETEEKLNDTGVTVDNISRPIDPSPRNETTEIDEITGSHQQNHPPKLEVPSESKSINPRLKSPVNASQVQKTISNNDISKTAVKKQNRRERESSQRKKSEKQSPQAAVPTRHSLLRTPKGEDAETSNSRLGLANKSGKEQIKKVAKSQPSGSKKIEPGVHRSPNRFKQTVSNPKPDTRTSTSGFSFRSDERAERRKQFYMKLEEKMHAKEAEINQIQAKTQEKTDAEIKQFRKSLNFKATPMPSFYHGAASPVCNGNKVTSSKGKPAKTQQKSTSMGNGASTRLQFLSKAKHNRAVAGETAVCHSTEPSEAGEPQPRNSIANAEAVNGVTSKEAEKATNLQRYRASENGRISKNHRVEGKPKTRDHRNSREMVRKSIEGVGMGRVAVGVA